jgi:predicted aconitase with swiveling domain
MSRPGVDGWTSIEALTLCPGDGNGELLVLDEPLSFWGGTDLHTGIITDVHHSQRGISLSGRVLAMTASRGSSSSSSVLAEQIRAGVGPAAIIVSERDAILTLGALAAAEIYGVALPIVLVEAQTMASLGEGRVRVVALFVNAVIERELHLPR